MTDFAPLDTFRDSADGFDPARSRRIRDEFRARIATSPTDADGRRPFDAGAAPIDPARRKTPRRPRVLALAALAVMVVLAAGGIVRLSPSRGGDGLDQLALAASARPDALLADGQYLHLTERTIASTGESQREQWTSTNGTGQTIESALTLQRPADPPTLRLHTTPGSLEFAGLSYDELRSLPTEPNALRQQLRRLGVATSDRPNDEATALARVLALEVTPPDVAAVAVRALEQLGGTAIGAVPAASGRVGEGVRGDNGDGTSWLVVIDAGTGLALAVHPSMRQATPATPTVGQVWTAQDIANEMPTP